MKGIFSLFPSPPAQEEISDAVVVQKEYNYWRWRIFYSMFIGYAFYYVTRKSFIFAMPGMIEDLGFDKGQLGFLATIMAITYGLSKFISGIIADHSNARYFMSIGLLLTGVFNIFFGLSSTLTCFALFWGLNGFFQAFGAPPSARLLTYWYSRNERGRWWACWNVSHNIGGALIPLIASSCTYYLGWRYALYVPGTICILVSFFLLNRLRDTPRSLGLPAIETFRSDHSEIDQTKNPDKVYSIKETLVDSVLSNKKIWLLAAAYFFVYIVRMGIDGWTALFLQETRGYSAVGASFFVTLFEAGGFLGSLAAAWASDSLFGGNRNPVNVLCTLGLVFVLPVFWFSPGNFALLESFTMFIMGFLIFGPQMLIGMVAAEMVHKSAAATATGFVGLFAYLGAATAGYPLGIIAQEWGWDGFLWSIAFCCGAALVCLLPLLYQAKKTAPLPIQGNLSNDALKA